MTRASALEAKSDFPALARPAPLLYRLGRAPARRLFARLFDFTVQGLEVLPASGPYIIAANHHNYLDGVLLTLAVPETISFLVMPRVWRATALHPMFHRHIRSIRIDLAHPHPGLRTALTALDAGRVVCIFPEGPFSVRGRLEAGLDGVAVLALKSHVPVVPAAIHGTYEALVGRRAYMPRRHPLSVRFGAPRTFSRDLGAERHAARARVTARIMDDIAALLG